VVSPPLELGELLPPQAASAGVRSATATTAEAYFRSITTSLPM
jgi:hypothetical protein